MRTQTILIVDDTITNLDILISLLKDYDVIDTTNGLDALEIANEEKIDLILLDIVMPNMDGYEVCKRLKMSSKTKDIPVIFITALNQEDAIEKAYDIGGIDYITKPFKPKELLARVKTQLEFRELQHKELQYNKQLALSELIHNIAHQWRQPLSIISTVASGIRVKSEFNEIEKKEIIENMDEITLQTKYLSKTIDDFEDLVKNQNQKSDFSLIEAVQKAISILQTSIIINNIKVVSNLKDDFLIEGFQDKFIQALINILKNSIDIINEKIEKNQKRLIFLDVGFENEKLNLIIKDNAGGIEEESIDKVFDPYFTTKHQSIGTGLGLSMTYQILNKYHHATITVTNETFSYEDKIYKGACFNITF